jgi:hypothetical protein
MDLPTARIDSPMATDRGKKLTGNVKRGLEKSVRMQEWYVFRIKEILRLFL